MKQLDAVYLADLHQKDDYRSLAVGMQALDWHHIDQVNWENDYPYRPTVQFQIAYSQQAMVLHYQVEETFLRAQAVHSNGNVWEDSCVEFFVSFDQREHYYNFEFNILGTGLIGYGPETKSARRRLSASEIQKVKTFTQIQQIDGVKTWQIMLVIPVELVNKDYESLRGTQAFGNFYKCGDALPDPHFVSWNPITHERPNFHLPAYFGQINFQR